MPRKSTKKERSTRSWRSPRTNARMPEMSSNRSSSNTLNLPPHPGRLYQRLEITSFCMNFLVIIITLALLFDFINGFHDAPITIATIVSTKVLTPLQAVLWAALFNFAAFFIFRYFIGEFKIGNTIAHFVDRDFITLPVIFSGLIAAISWNLLTWWLGIPSSSSHTLIGGFVGAALAHAGGFFVHGKNVIDYATVIPTFCFIVLAPLIGFIVALVITILIVNLFRRSHPYKAEGWFRRLQLLSSAALSQIGRAHV